MRLFLQTAEFTERRAAELLGATHDSRLTTSRLRLASAAAQEWRNVEIVVRVRKHGLGQARAPRADPTRTLRRLGRPVAVSSFDRQAAVAPAGRRWLGRRGLARREAIARAPPKARLRAMHAL